ncbi:cellulose biosynthesis cyclic di-GMP-binding regulatory protein BcsB [Allochromatium palmeri]|nr:cellulose biosynthesis cyclic di-GMP-binding regulatory protein BcsB [Allochromatium palmeri]
MKYANFHSRRDRARSIPNQHAFLSLLLTMVLLTPSLGIAQATTEAVLDESTTEAGDGTNAASAAGTRRIERSLASFTDAFKDARLLGSRAQINFDIPLPARWEPRELRLDLVYRNSVNLLQAHSQLRVELNGLIIAQLRLDPERPEGRAQIRLPLDLLRVGYNQLVFAVAQHTLVEDCEDPGAPELWTQIDTQGSRLHLDYEPRSLNTSLSALEELFDARLWNKEPWRILMPPSQNAALDDAQLTWGALVAQAIAIHLGFVPPTVESAPLTLGTAQDGSQRRFAALNASDLLDRDAILIGTRDQLRPILGAEWASSVTDGYLALFAQPNDDTRALLIVSGRDAQEVERAATTLAFMETPFPDRAQVLVSDLIPPDIPANSGPGLLPGGVKARFMDLGASTTTLVSPLAPASWFTDPGFSGSGTQVSAVQRHLRLDFWIQPDFHIMGSEDAILSLNFSYGAAFRGDSVLNLLVNGVFVRGIPLDDPVGASLYDYRLRIPSSLLRAGPNRLELVPMLVPLKTDRCQLRQGENLLMTVYGDSALQLPFMTQFSRLPDLALLVQSGFPWIRDLQGRDLAVQVVSGSREAAGAAWTLLARLAQINGVPLHRARLGTAPDTEGRESIVVGVLNDLDPVLRDAAPLYLGEKTSRIDYTTLRVLTEPETALAWWESPLAILQGWFTARPAEPREFESHVTYAGHPLGRLGLLMAFESPTQTGRSVLLLSATEPQRLLERATQIVQPEYWFNVRGSLVLWNDKPDELRWQPARQTFIIGEGPTEARLSYLFGHYPQALQALLLGLAALLALLLLILMRRFRRRHHPLIHHEDN